jgi:hypothetical protein
MTIGFPLSAKRSIRFLSWTIAKICDYRNDRILLSDLLLKRLRLLDHRGLSSLAMLFEMVYSIDEMVMVVIFKDEQHISRIAVPSSFIPVFLRIYHDSEFAGHFGIKKPLQRISAKFHWPSMIHDVKRYVQSCDVCNRTKPKNHRHFGLLNSREIPAHPFEVIYVDLIGPLPAEKSSRACHIIVCIDQLTKFVIAQPARQATARNVATFLLNQVFFQHGFVKTLVFDGALYNRSKFFLMSAPTFRFLPRFIIQVLHRSNEQIDVSTRSFGRSITPQMTGADIYRPASSL